MILLTENLKELGYKTTANELFCPLGDKNYLDISIDNKEFKYSIIEYDEDNEINFLTTDYPSKRPITVYNKQRNDDLAKEWKKLDKKGDIKDIISDISTTLSNEGIDFTDIVDNFGKSNKSTYGTKDKHEEDMINLRRNPKLVEKQEERVEKVEEIIKEVGLIPYLEKVLDKIHIGSHSNIYRKILGAFKIMKGEGSYIFETTAKAGEGKSLEDEIVFGIIIPSDYIYKVNSITSASFTRYADKSNYYFDRKILLLGDAGSEKSLEKMEEILDIFKVLITEKEYVRDITDENRHNNKRLELKVASIGGAYSTVINSFTKGDSQLESRTLYFTPTKANDEEVLNFLFALQYEDSKESKAKKKAKRELRYKFQKYLLSLVNKKLIIINPYREVFKRYVEDSEVPRREFIKIVELFDAYCQLTHFNCRNINGKLVSSESQITEFMQEICLENALIPYESNFLVMLTKGKKKLTLITENKTEDEETEDEEIDEEETTDVFDEYYKTALDMSQKSKKNNNQDDDEDEDKELNVSDLDPVDREKFVKKLLELYRLGSTSSKHKENVFFRIGDIDRVYSKYKAYKNIDNMYMLINNLVKKGYINYIEYRDGNQRIYYLTDQCRNLTQQFELTDGDRESAEEFLKEIGVT